jgi:hypothetical protein
MLKFGKRKAEMKRRISEDGGRSFGCLWLGGRWDEEQARDAPATGGENLDFKFWILDEESGRGKRGRNAEAVGRNSEWKTGAGRASHWGKRFWILDFGFWIFSTGGHRGNGGAGAPGPRFKIWAFSVYTRSGWEEV